MVVLVDLESDDDEPCGCMAAGGEQARAMMPACHAAAPLLEKGKAAGDSEPLSGPVAFSAALTCYPVALALASHLDLNDLHALSLTCRAIRDSLVQYAPRLVAGSLRCSFDGLPLLADLLHAQFEIAIGQPDHDGLASAPGTPPSSSSVAAGPSLARSAVAVSAKTFPCARDLVAPCQKCDTVVCRNCAAKAPSDRCLAERHRRLCRKCLDAPLIAHLQPLRGADELPVGQKCGRGEHCLETGPEGVSWVELDCSSSGDEHEAWPLSRSGTPAPAPMLLGDWPSPSPPNKRPGYFQQEIEGIGGVVKTKVRKRVKVGATVHEHEDERRTGKYLERESIYYDNEDAIRKQLLGPHNRAVTSYINRGRSSFSPSHGPYPPRRTSHDEYLEQDQELLIDVERTLKDLIEQEDVDGDQQITIDDHGPKHIALGTFGSAGYRSTDVRGNYMISNLLQELTLARDLGKKVVKLHRSRLNENPVDRLSRRIRDEFWKNLERCLDASSIEKAGKDPKDWTDDPRPRIYVPHGCPEQYEYYTQVARERPEMRLDVRWLPQDGLDAKYVRGLNDAPGILALAMTKTVVNGKEVLRGEPFVVPGGRFNELYGWDSYMESLGLIENGRVGLAKAMVTNFIFCIQHYGKILNANRSYYLCRSQPPFLTDMVLRVYDKIKHDDGALDFLRNGIRAAIKEYYSVWTAEPRYDPVTGLSRYRPTGLGVPPETEASHFVHIITPYAKSRGLTFAEYVQAYNKDEIDEPELDEYFLHDRAVRESGHDTTYRLEGCAANLATIDLNALLYKYEMDIAYCIRQFFKDALTIPPEFQTEANRLDGVETSATWDRRAKLRKARVDKYMWDEKAGMYFDYDTVKKKRTTYESATTFWAMWAGLSSPRQAASLVLNALPKFEVFGGLVSGSEESRGRIGLDRPNRQWDYPFGWAPQQILAWGGLIRYGYGDEAQRLAYKWLYMVTKAFVDFNGVVVEKYNVVRELDPHKVEAEYGNQGSDFKGVPREGFGWVNASYVYGLSFLPIAMKRALGTLTPWELFAKATKIKLDDDDDDDNVIQEHSDEEEPSMPPAV
ncbi:hypothetical protein DV737_g4666, partial [Chaetothyriales sp. CBS 132003]